MVPKRLRVVGIEESKNPYQSQLDYLYARRSALDALIESLEEYERCRVKRTEFRDQRTA